MSKSFVTIAQKMCIVTGKPYDSGELLLDTRMKERFDQYTIVGWGYSPEVQEKLDQEFVALVEVDFDKSKKDLKGQITPEDAYRLGRVVYIKRNVLAEIVPSLKINYMSWAEPGFLDYLAQIPVKP